MTYRQCRPCRSHAPGQSGNILFLILLAVVLFAALSYAVTSSMRGGGNNAGKETLSTEISKFENFGMSVRTSLMRMNTIGGYQLWQLSYAKDGFSASANNTTCTSNACRLHAMDGGGIGGYLMPTTVWQSSSACTNVAAYAGRYYFRNVSIKGVGLDAKADLTMFYNGASDDLCKAVNDKYGVTNPGDAPPVDYATSIVDYDGTLTQEVALDQAVGLGDGEASVSGKQMFCTKQSSGCNHLFIVLQER